MSHPWRIRQLSVGADEYSYISLTELGDVSSLPYSLRALLDNIVTSPHADFEAVSAVIKSPRGTGDVLIPYTPARVLLQDYTGVACLVDLVSLGEAVAEADPDSSLLEPAVPVQLVIDHSISADFFGNSQALERNMEMDYMRNGERYAFFRWCEETFEEVSVVPPGNGIIHQVNVEYLAEVVCERDGLLSLDTCVGTDSHTTMINALGILGWGVGGLDAISAAVQEPIDLLLPSVVGVQLTGQLPAGVTATDLVLTITERLREHGVVGKFVEFYGTGLAEVPLATRATISNMSPEFGSTCAYFPIDEETLRYLRLTGRSEEHVAKVEAYVQAQGLWHDADTEPLYDEKLSVDLSTVEASVAGPRRPQDRMPLSEVGRRFRTEISAGEKSESGQEGAAPAESDLQDGAVVVASITSCTNTSNPSVMMAAGLLAKKAAQRGLKPPVWVKTSLAPGSTIVTDYLDKAGLTEYLEKLGFHLVGFGCTTCAGNSGPLPEEVSRQIHEHGLSTAAVLSGNRNFEGRINPDVALGYLASPPLVIAYALAGTVDLDLTSDPLGVDHEGLPVYLNQIWPSEEEIQAVVEGTVSSELFVRGYKDLYRGDARWRNLEIPEGSSYHWNPSSTYLQRAPYLDSESRLNAPQEISGARALLWLGDSVTTDHISPAGAIKESSPAGQYLLEHGVQRKEFNSYGARRGNHEVMIRGTFANPRLQNRLVPDMRGGYTKVVPTGEILDVYSASLKYAESATPLVVLAGQGYGAGSSRDWAAKGTALLGVRAVIAESFERIHRSNLVAMGVLPLEFLPGESAEALGLTGEESFTITAPVTESENATSFTTIRAENQGGVQKFQVRVRLDTPREIAYYAAGGLMPYLWQKYLRTSAGSAVQVGRVQ